MFPPEIFYLILTHLNLDDLKNISKVSKQFKNIVDDDYFWKLKFELDYPGCIYDHPIYRKHKRYVHQSYLKDIKPGSEKYQDLEICLLKAIKKQDKSLVKYFLERGSSNYFEAIYLASVINDPDIIFSITKHSGPIEGRYLDAALARSIKGGNLDVFDKIAAELTQTTFINYALYAIASMGNFNCMSLFFRRLNDFEFLDISRWDSGLLGAVESGNLELVKMFLNYCDNAEDAMISAIEYDQVDILKFLIERYEYNLYDLYYTASALARKEILCYLLELPRDVPLYNFFSGALDSGDLTLVKIAEKKVIDRIRQYQTELSLYFDDDDDDGDDVNLKYKNLIFDKYQDLDSFLIYQNIDDDNFNEDNLDGILDDDNYDLAKVRLSERSVINMGIYHSVSSRNFLIIEDYISRGARFSYPVLNKVIKDEKIDLLEFTLYLIDKYQHCRPKKGVWILTLRDGLIAKNKTYIEYIKNIVPKILTDHADQKLVFLNINLN